MTRNVYSHSNLLLDTIFFVWLRLLVGEQLNRNKPKKIVSASRGFLAAARLSCNNIASARRLIDNLGRRISENSDEAGETSFLYQRISILLQCFNAVLRLQTVQTDDRLYFVFSSFIF